MRRHSFILTILGLLSLLLILIFSKPLYLNQNTSMKKLQPNQKLAIQGQVTKETQTKTNRILTIKTQNQTLKAECFRPCPSFLNKNVSALASLEKYNGKIRLKALEIISLS